MPPDSDFYAAAERRIWRFQLIIAALGGIVALSLAGPRAAAAFLAGAAISSLNFFWLKQAVDALAEKAAAGAATAKRKHRLLVWKFLGRYALIGVAAYAILKYTVWNIKALLAGLFLFVAAILAEIVFEIVSGLTSDRHGT